MLQELIHAIARIKKPGRFQSPAEGLDATEQYGIIAAIECLEHNFEKRNIILNDEMSEVH